MDSLTDELLGIKKDKYAVGDLVKTRASIDATGQPWIGIIRSITILKNKEGSTKNLYTIDWVDEEAKEVLWYDWYDEDLQLVQKVAKC